MLSGIRHSFRSLPLFVPSLLIPGAVGAQQRCGVLPIHESREAHNIFGVQQELDLGDIEAEWLEKNQQVIPGGAFEGGVTAISNRLLSQITIPESERRIRIILIDIPEANSFSVGTSRIYITRKMIAVLRNDDELAGLLGHELEHILAHQNAVVVTQVFHDSLGVSSVSDRKDIAGKFERMLNGAEWNTAVMRAEVLRIQRQEEIHQYETDRFALCAMAAAGFSPRAYVELFDRFAETHGRRGNLLTDLLGMTTPNEKRLRTIYKSLRLLPKPCREIASPPSSAEFLAWREEVMAHPGLTFSQAGPR
jgi:predicted Zn-dependent protease